MSTTLMHHQIPVPFPGRGAPDLVPLGPLGREQAPEDMGPEADGRLGERHERRADLLE